MAKTREIPPWILLIAGVVLLTTGWIVSPFFILIAFAPVFALTTRAKESSYAWEKMEWVWATITYAAWAAVKFKTDAIVSSLIIGIVFTLPFMGYVWVRHILGSRAGLFTIVILWLALEYLEARWLPAEGFFLADALQREAAWCAWNQHTGFLGGSAWILFSGLLAYQAVLSDRAGHWTWIVLLTLVVIGPILLGYAMEEPALDHTDLVNLYSGAVDSMHSTYLARGEWLARTCLWVSTLILLFTLVKAYTRKR